MGSAAFTAVMPSRRRRVLRAIQVPFGTRRRPRRWPEAEDIIRGTRRRRPGDDDGPAAPPRSPGPPPTADDDGGAGVREPRRPHPTAPGASAAALPEPDQFLDLEGTTWPPDSGRQLVDGERGDVPGRAVLE